MVRAYQIPRDSLVGKTVIITGGNFGIGRAASLAFARDGGANVIIASRSAQRLNESKASIDKELAKSNAKGSIETEVVDISNMESVRIFAKSFLNQNKPLDILVNNAGLVVKENCKTAEGYEIHYAISQGHFLLSLLLMPALKKAPSARIVTVSSVAHMKVNDIPYDKVKGDKVLDKQSIPECFNSYCVSKLANVYYSKWLGLELKKQGFHIVTASLHPGVVATGIWKVPSWLQWLLPLLMLTEEQGARTTLFCATSPEVKETGLYYRDCAIAKSAVDDQENKENEDAKMETLVDTTSKWLNMKPIQSHL